MNRRKKNCCACSLQPGDTAHLVTGSPHLHIVLCPPIGRDNEVIVVNITSNIRSDPTTILHRGDHPFIRVPSAVFYRGAYKKRCCEIEELFEKKGKWRGYLQPFLTKFGTVS